MSTIAIPSGVCCGALFGERVVGVETEAGGQGAAQRSQKLLELILRHEALRLGCIVRVAELHEHRSTAATMRQPSAFHAKNGSCACTHSVEGVERLGGRGQLPLRGAALPPLLLALRPALHLLRGLGPPAAVLAHLLLRGFRRGKKHTGG